ncbi:outer membrane protein assembly factor BamB family protein [Mariniblastus fucicola]|uniref:Outer membrane biogenesis protein BamB n=1 Tax=Mariniblastus fucicola TaxID=980251 RepID=A0A5B9PAV0_9BACT|nr:PQQ-binding-like beta-propeller repeat protein [Mariniblastus fucicola]QEG22629.1 outer membrane biogenesis protein BamB [Mariniblastus fucicola]
MKLKHDRIPVYVLACVLSIAGTVSADDWTGFLGPGAASVAADAVLPKVIDDESNVSWKIPLPAKGASSPIIVGDNVIVTCSGGQGDKQNELMVVCVDKNSGAKKWEQKFWATGRCFCHPLSANAAPTPATDGERIFAFYSSNDIACLDLDGNLLWYRGLAADRPKAGNDVGMSSSPVVVDDVVVCQVENAGDSFATGLDAKTGETVWSQDRGKTAVWATPLVIKTRDGKNLVLVQSADKIDVLDPKTGEVKFQQEGDVSTISSACIVGDTVITPMDGTTAFQVSSDGSIEPKWSQGQIKAGSPSYQVTENSIFTCNSRGILRVWDRESGDKKKEARIDGSYWATPIIADGHMYCFGDDGTFRLVNLHMGDDQKPEVVQQHKFLAPAKDGADTKGEVFLGSPAISGNAMFVRSNNFLWKFAAE